MSGISCPDFHDSVDELALGVLDEPARSRLTAHAAGCSDCQLLLEALSSVADRLVLLAPEHEPPSGFESRALSGFPAAPPVSAGRRRGVWRGPVTVLVAAAALAAAVIGGVALERRDGPGVGVAAGRAAVIEVADGGRRIGEVHLLESPSPHLLVIIDRPVPGNDRVTCELSMADGRVVDVGSWNYEEVSSGVWAVGIASELLGATAMHVRKDGAVIASASFA